MQACCKENLVDPETAPGELAGVLRFPDLFETQVSFSLCGWGWGWTARTGADFRLQMNPEHRGVLGSHQPQTQGAISAGGTALLSIPQFAH